MLVVGSDGLLRSDSSFTADNDALVAATPIATLGRPWATVAVMVSDEVLAPVANMRNMMLTIGAGLLAMVGALGLLFSRTTTKPITRLTDTMQALAEGDLDVEVRGAQRTDELGAMTRAIEVFRENGLKATQMTEAEAAQIIRTQSERAAMMLELQRASGNVVDAATAGDFSKRVDAQFPDAELNALASSVNALVDTVDRGLGETGEVLAGLANTDLTRRVTGSFEGAFARLKNDANAVAEKLSEIVDQLRETSDALKTTTGEILAGTI